MGFYINPLQGTKEEWLAQYGQEVSEPQWPPPPGQVLVCLVHNPTFTAAGICYKEEEFDHFIMPDATPEQIAAEKERAEAMGMAFFSIDSGQPRKREWYHIPRAVVVEVQPAIADLLEV